MAQEVALSLLPTAEQQDPVLSYDRIKRCGPDERYRRLARRDRLEEERGEWATALNETRTVWMRAYEGRDTGTPMAVLSELVNRVRDDITGR